MYRFDPHGSKDIKNLIIHNNIEDLFIYSGFFEKNPRVSFHRKSLFCYDQEPLNFDLYSSDYYNDSRKSLFFNHEGKTNQFNNEIGKKIIKRKNIAGHSLVTPSIYNKNILLHSEKNSKDLEKYERSGFIGAYYWSHAFLALDWYRFAKHDQNFKNLSNTSFSKDFNIYCRAWTGTREYRLKFLSLLPNSVAKKSNIFFSIHSENSKFYDYEFQNSNWKIAKKEIEKIANLNFITRENQHSGLSASYDAEDYLTSAIDVVLETVYDMDKIQLTEKILRPIACGKPFILVSEKGSLEYLRSYGFKTFGSLIDESYDKVNCSKERLESIVRTMKTISNLSEKEKNKLFLEMHKIADYNKKWFFSEKFFNVIDKELKNNLTKALAILDKPENQTGKVPMTAYRAYRRYQQYFSGDAKKLADIIVREYPERIKLSKKNIGIS